MKPINNKQGYRTIINLTRHEVDPVFSKEETIRVYPILDLEKIALYQLHYKDITLATRNHIYWTYGFGYDQIDRECFKRNNPVKFHSPNVSRVFSYRSLAYIQALRDAYLTAIRDLVLDIGKHNETYNCSWLVYIVVFLKYTFFNITVKIHKDKTHCSIEEDGVIWYMDTDGVLTKKRPKGDFVDLSLTDSKYLDDFKIALWVKYKIELTGLKDMNVVEKPTKAKDYYTYLTKFRYNYEDLVNSVNDEGVIVVTSKEFLDSIDGETALVEMEKDIEKITKRLEKKHKVDDVDMLL